MIGREFTYRTTTNRYGGTGLLCSHGLFDWRWLKPSEFARYEDQDDRLTVSEFVWALSDEARRQRHEITTDDGTTWILAAHTDPRCFEGDPRLVQTSRSLGETCRCGQG